MTASLKPLPFLKLSLDARKMFDFFTKNFGS